MNDVPLPLDLDRAFRFRRQWSMAEIGLGVSLLFEIWKSNERCIHLTIPDIEAFAGANRSLVLHRVYDLIYSEFWWNPRDCYLYSPYILEIIAKPTQRHRIPAWMKEVAIGESIRAGGRGEPNFSVCHYCDSALGADCHFDHALPLVRGGINHPQNLRLCCPACSMTKGIQTEQEFIARLRRLQAVGNG